MELNKESGTQQSPDFGDLMTHKFGIDILHAVWLRNPTCGNYYWRTNDVFDYKDVICQIILA